MSIKDTKTVNSPLTKLYRQRQAASSDFAGLSKRIITVLVNNNYTKEKLHNEIMMEVFEPDKLPNLGSRSFEEILEWIEYE